MKAHPSPAPAAAPIETTRVQKSPPRNKKKLMDTQPLKQRHLSNEQKLRVLDNVKEKQEQSRTQLTHKQVRTICFDLYGVGPCTTAVSDMRQKEDEIREACRNHYTSNLCKVRKSPLEELGISITPKAS